MQRVLLGTCCDRRVTTCGRYRQDRHTTSAHTEMISAPPATHAVATGAGFTEPPPRHREQQQRSDESRATDEEAGSKVLVTVWTTMKLPAAPPTPKTTRHIVAKWPSTKATATSSTERVPSPSPPQGEHLHPSRCTRCTAVPRLAMVCPAVQYQPQVAASPHRHRRASAQIHPEDLPTLMCSAHRGSRVADVKHPSISRGPRGAKAPLLSIQSWEPPPSTASSTPVV